MVKKSEEQSCDNCNSRNGILCHTFMKLVLNFKNSGRDCGEWGIEENETMAKSV